MHRATPISLDASGQSEVTRDRAAAALAAASDRGRGRETTGTTVTTAMPKAESGVSAPLLSGDVNSSVSVPSAPPPALVTPALGAPFSRPATVPSSLDDAKCCRICLESTDNADPFAAGRLIAPCQCRGTSAWVHRGCLDRWRATQEDRAFSQCTECRFSYEYVQTAGAAEDKGWLFDDGPLTAKRRRRAKFQLFVARDFLAVFLVLQLCIFVIGGVVRKADCGTWLACAYSPSSADPKACCASGYLVNHIFPLTLMREHTQSAYYLVGLVLFFAGVGLVGCCNKRVLPAETQCCSDTGGCNCCGGYNNYYWWYWQPAPGGGSGGGGGCDCCCDVDDDCCDVTPPASCSGGGSGGGGSNGGECCSSVERACSPCHVSVPF
jgi:hypothetical protein